MDRGLSGPQQTVRLHVVEHAEECVSQPRHYVVQVVGAVDQIVEDGIDPTPEGDDVPEVEPAREDLLAPVMHEVPRLRQRLDARPLVDAGHPTLQSHWDDTVEDRVRLLLDARGRFLVEAERGTSDLLDVILGRQLVVISV